MSILSALKAKGAKGNNIEEAVKTLPIGGSDGGGAGTFFITITKDDKTGDYKADKSFDEVYEAYATGINIAAYIVEFRQNSGWAKHILPCSGYSYLNEGDGISSSGFSFELNNIREMGAESVSSEQHVGIFHILVDFYRVNRGQEVLGDMVEVRCVDFMSDSNWEYKEL